jgi:hypothetical protein
MFEEIFTKKFIIGDSFIEYLISLITIVIIGLSIYDLIMTWTYSENEKKPYGWETTIGLIGLIVPVLLGSIKYIYLKRRNFGSSTSQDSLDTERRCSYDTKKMIKDV